MLHRNRWRAALLLIALAIVRMPPAAAGEQALLRADEAQAGSLLLATPEGSRAATRINTDIAIAVSGLVARTTVRQAFRNDGKDRVEGIYVFPLPDGAAVDHLRMHIGERYIEGEIRERAEAREVYERARATGKRSGLVEQQRANLFTTSIANVPAGETIVIEIEYLETVTFDDGLFSIRVPLTLTPRYIPGEPLPDRSGSGWSPDTDRVPDASLITPPVTTGAVDDHRVTLRAEIEAGVPLERVASRYHPVTISELDPATGRYRIELADERVPMDHDIELTWRPTTEAVPRAALFSESVAGSSYYLLMLLPPNEVPAGYVPMPRDLVFVIDTSGSMFGTSLAQAQAALRMALERLRPTDRFNVVQFNSNTSALFAESVSATDENLSQALRYVAALVANGGTEMRPALEQVLHSATSETHLRQVVFITDGSVGNEAELVEQIRSGVGAARLFTVGIGSAPNGWFMRRAASAGRGSYTWISAQHEVAEKMQSLLRKLEHPQVTDIRVEWPGGSEDAVFPAVVPDLYAGEPLIVKAKLPVSPRAGDQVRITGESPDGRWGATVPLAATREHAGIAAVWARAEIEDLLDRERAGNGGDDVRKRVTDTALEHHLVSPYTSLVAVDRTPVGPGAPPSTERVPNLLPYGQSARAIFGLPSTATSQPLHLAAGTVFLLLAGLVWLIRGREPSGVHRHAPIRGRA